MGTSEGFLVYQTSPHNLISKTVIEGGVRTAQIMVIQGDKIFMAFIGTGKSMKYPRHKIVFRILQIKLNYFLAMFIWYLWLGI